MADETKQKPEGLYFLILRMEHFWLWRLMDTHAAPIPVIAEAFTKYVDKDEAIDEVRHIQPRYQHLPIWQEDGGVLRLISEGLKTVPCEEQCYEYKSFKNLRAMALGITGNPKRMSVKEFRALGLLHEINRRVLHPLGLGIEVSMDKDTGEEMFGGVHDFRDDPEGMLFGELDKEKMATVAAIEAEKHPVREKVLGFVIQTEDFPPKEDA